MPTPPTPPQPPKPPLVRGRCSCGQAYSIRDPGPKAKVLCPACGRVMKLRALEFGITSGPIAAKWERDKGQPQVAILRDHGELSLAPQGSRPGLTGEKLFTNRDSMLLGAQNQWPEGWSLLDRPAEVAQNDWLASGPPVRRSWPLDVLASFWCAGVPRNAVALAGLTVGWLFLRLPIEWLFTPNNASACLVWPVFGPMVATWAFITLRHFGLTIRDTAIGEDDVFWARDGTHVWRDFFAPALGFFAAIAICFGPFLLLGNEVPALGDSLAYRLFTGLLASVFIPLALLNLLAASSAVAWRPDVAWRNFTRLWPHYGLIWLAGLATAAFLGWIAEGGIARLAAGAPGVPPLGASLIVGLYAAYVYARTVGLLVRIPGAKLKGLYQPNMTRRPWEQ